MQRCRCSDTLVPDLGPASWLVVANVVLMKRAFGGKSGYAIRESDIRHLGVSQAASGAVSPLATAATIITQVF